MKLKLPFESLLDFSRGLFCAVGLKEKHARLAAEAICSASLRGVDSHGIRLLPHYIEAIEAGRIDPKARFDFQRAGAAAGSLDARHGMAHAAVATAMDHAVALAAGSGVGLVSVRNSNHCGAMAYYAERACAHDMIGLAFTHATPKLQVFNSTKPFFGINPVCFTAPMEGEEPFCYDSAPAVMSNNKIKMYIESGGSLPPGTAADARGRPTTDPSLAAMLLPLGGPVAGYKGYGLAMVVDILCALLSGMPGGGDVSVMYEKDGGRITEKRFLGQFVGAIRISAFEDPARFRKRLREQAEAVRALPRAAGAGQEVMVPGDPEKKTRAERLEKGIPVPSRLLEKLRELAGRHGVDFCGEIAEK